VTRQRRERSASESLLSITLLLEGFLVFFVALTAFSLRVVTPLQALVGGVVLIVLLAVAGRLARYPAGRWLGWALQGALIALGILLPLMYLIGAGFLALWAFCFVKGRSLDAAKAAHLATVSTGSTTEKETP
jgi:hypothetical protein